MAEKTNLQGETFDQWLAEFKEDYKREYGEEYPPRSRRPDVMIEYWELGWDLERIEEYEDWLGYTPI